MEREWEKYNCTYLAVPECGLAFDFSSAPVGKDFLEANGEKVQEALRELERIERGERVNVSEDRMVGHYWLRNPDMAPAGPGREIRQSLEEIAVFASDVRAGRIKPAGKALTRVVHIGIGGSALGPQFFLDALGTAESPAFCFLDSSDPEGAGRVAEQIGGEIGETLVIVVSKSGDTHETMNNFRIMSEVYGRYGFDIADFAVAVTLDGSRLSEKAAAEGWLKTFSIWDWVGGRTSVFSPAGLLPAALAGLDIEEILAGAAAADVRGREKDVFANPSLYTALWLRQNSAAGRDVLAVIPYCDRLVLLGRYLQQLFMESLGKKFDLRGKIVEEGVYVLGNKGSTDQHSYVQQLMEGKDRSLVNMIEILDGGCKLRGVTDEAGNSAGDFQEAFLMGTEEALKHNGRFFINISMETVSERTVGALVAFYERVVGFYAALAGINAYDQPAVERGKEAAGEILLCKETIRNVFREKDDDFSVREISDATGIDPVRVFRILAYLAASYPEEVEIVQGGAPEEHLYCRPAESQTDCKKMRKM